MKTKLENTVKKAMSNIQEAITLLESVRGQNEQVDETCDNIGFAFADLEYEVNS